VFLVLILNVSAPQVLKNFLALWFVFSAYNLLDLHFLAHNLTVSSTQDPKNLLASDMFVLNLTVPVLFFCKKSAKMFVLIPFVSDTSGLT